MRRGALPAALLAGLLAAGSAQALRVDGLAPHETLEAGVAGAQARDGRLEIQLADGRMLSVADWPAFLPRRLGPQRLAASRTLRPSGPSDRLALTHSNDERPWLQLGSRARRGETLLGPWQLQLRGSVWSLTDGAAEQALGLEPEQAAPVVVAADAARWCVYLLRAQLPRPRPGIASEEEAQIDWAALRLADGRRRCPAPR